MSVGTEVNTMEFINDIASNPLIWNRDSVTSKLGCDEIWRGLSTKYNAGGAYTFLAARRFKGFSLQFSGIANAIC